MIKKKHGGPRKGAGRPVGSTTERTEKLMVRLTPKERAKAEAAGKGNASEGLRIALAAFSR